MKRQTLMNGLLSLTVVSVMTACVDDKYDLTDIDTTSRFTVDNLTVPVNLSEIKLENVINLDDNENISVENGEYVIKKGGSIAPTDFNINGVHINAPNIDATSINVGLGGLPVAPGTFIPAKVDLGPISFNASDLVGYEFKVQNVDKALVWLKDIKTSPIEVKVILSIPAELIGTDNKISFEDLELQLPWGLLDVKGVAGYDTSTGKVTLPPLPVGANGKAELTISAGGMELNEQGKIKDGVLSVAGQVGVLGGKIKLSLQNVTLPSDLNIGVNYEVSGFDVNSFSGQIDYKMDDISIAPIKLNDLPEFLNDPLTNIFISNPSISIDVNNPIAKYGQGVDGLVGEGQLTLTSTFKNGKSVGRTSDVFKLIDPDGDGVNKIILTPNVVEGEADMYEFKDLGYVLTYYPYNPAAISYGWGLPETIAVSIEGLKFFGSVTDFPLKNIGSASGDYSFTAPLGFGDGTTIFYETTENGWSSDDLDKVNIQTIHLKADCSTDLPVSIKVKVVPVDKDGKEIAVREDYLHFSVPANAQNEPVSLVIEAKDGSTISGFDGVRFFATIGQNSPEGGLVGGDTNPLGPNLHLKLNDLRVTVDGYYETDF